MERLFQILAVIFAAAAGVLFWLGYTDGLFVAAVLGAVCFFLSIRFQVKGRMANRDMEPDEPEEP
ncbi:MAG: hypothetical protein KBD94_09700 [Pyrinomonadaceae bacterium]|nr:hypothetical protein [Pyrinomonadaceae bacterium]